MTNIKTTKTMNKIEIASAIRQLRKERKEVVTAWNYIKQLNDEIGFSFDCYKELEARISEELRLIDKAIRDCKENNYIFIKRQTPKCKLENS